MMINKLLLDFDKADLDKQMSIVETLFDVLDDEIVDKLSKIGVDRSADEFLRSRIFEVLYSGVDVGVFHSRFSDMVREVLNREDDELVRQHAAKASWRFCDVRQVISTLEDIVADAEQDLDVRHNAFTALARNRRLPESRNSLERLMKVKEFMSYAKDALSRE
jgi:hypothetical protein